MMKNKLLLFVVALVVLGGTFLVATKMYQEEETKKFDFLAKENFDLFVPDYAPRVGSTNPEVYLVEFLDPECESCREFYPMVKLLMQEFDGKIQLVVRYAPFHGNSKFIIKILEASRKQGKYWDVLETLFQYQPQWGSHHHPRPELVWTYLPETGIDIDKLKLDMNDPVIDQMIAQEIEAGRVLGVRGTPTFFVNGKPLLVFSLESLRTLIQENLKQ